MPRIGSRSLSCRSGTTMTTSFTYKVNVPEGRSGKWAIERFKITRDEALLAMITGSLGSGRHVPSGTYTRLTRGDVTVMSDTPDEIRDHRLFIGKSQGDVLIAGLGLGMCARACLYRDAVKSVTVIEQSPEVIDLVYEPWLRRIARRQGKSLTVIQADIFTWEPPRGVVYDLAWFDIWDEISARNLPGMHRLHRRFARKAKWKGSWGRDAIESMRRAEERALRF